MKLLATTLLFFVFSNGFGQIHFCGEGKEKFPVGTVMTWTGKIANLQWASKLVLQDRGLCKIYIQRTNRVYDETRNQDNSLQGTYERLGNRVVFDFSTGDAWWSNPHFSVSQSWGVDRLNDHRPNYNYHVSDFEVKRPHIPVPSALGCISSAVNDDLNAWKEGEFETAEAFDIRV